MRIAVLGWGSLVWNPERLAAHIHAGEWVTGGPVLPMEFSRLTGDGRLVLCIDSAVGSPVETRWVLSLKEIVAEAVADLAARERVHPERIGGFVLATGESRTFHRSVVPAITAWASGRALDAVIWSDLPSNFKSFSVARAVAYLQKRDPDEAARAREEFRRATREEETPLRRKLREIGWIPPGGEPGSPLRTA